MHHPPGTLVVATVEEPDSIDPRYANLSAADDVIALAYDGLIKFGPHGEILPDLAVSVPSRKNGGVSADGKTITYHLRHGVRWQDGVPFTSRDVVYTWKSLMDPHANVPALGGYAQIASVDAPTPWTVRVRLKGPYAPAITLFADARQGAIVPAHRVSSPIGTGPYRITAWNHGDDIVFERNRYALRRPAFDRVILLFVPNEQSLLNLVRSGEADVAMHLTTDTVERARADNALTVYATPAFDWEHLTFNLRPGSGPQSNVHVRRAIAYALDPWSIRSHYFDGLGGLAPLDQAPASWARDSSVRFYRHDLALARRELLLADAPHPSLTLLSTTGNDARDRLEIAIQNACRQAGIAIRIKNVPANLLLARAADNGLLMSGRFEIALFSYVAVSPDPDDSRFVSSNAIPPNGVNMSAYRNGSVDRFVAHGQRSFDYTVRKRAYSEIQRRLIADLPFYTLIWPVDGTVIRRGLENVNPLPLGSPLWNIDAWKR